MRVLSCGLLRLSRRGSEARLQARNLTSSVVVLDLVPFDGLQRRAGVMNLWCRQDSNFRRAGQLQVFQWLSPPALPQHLHQLRRLTA